jgi:acylphosphatase
MTGNDTGLKRLKAVVSGRVQGVGFRYFVQRAASQAGLTGWVRNRRDGCVELVAEGDERSMGELAAALRRGPPSSFVSGVETEWSRPTGEFDSFEVRPTV